VVDVVKLTTNLDAFDLKLIAKSSHAAAGIAEWACAIVSFHDALLVVKPRQAQLKEVLDSQAIAALENLKASDITEIKSYMKPKEELVMVFNAVCLLMGVKQDWPTALGLMSNPTNFV